MAEVDIGTGPPVERTPAELTAQAAARLRRRERMRSESAEVASDPDDLADSQRVREELDPLRVW